jgi:hypothetical protein
VSIVRQLAKLLQHLRRVAPRTAVDPIGRLTAALGAVVAAATPAIVAVIIATIIVVQGRVFLNPASLLGTKPAGGLRIPVPRSRPPRRGPYICEAHGV